MVSSFVNVCLYCIVEYKYWLLRVLFVFIIQIIIFKDKQKLESFL